MKNLVMILFVVLLTACPGEAVKEMYETAKFEELQNNHLHAVEIYREILAKYPDSEYAGLSRERLSALKQLSQSG